MDTHTHRVVDDKVVIGYIIVQSFSPFIYTPSPLPLASTLTCPQMSKPALLPEPAQEKPQKVVKKVVKKKKVDLCSSSGCTTSSASSVA